MQRTTNFLIARDWARISIGAGLIAVWLLVLAGVPTVLPMQAASWLVFLALLIAPGYLLGDLITRQLGLDSLERLALALPLGVVVLAVPGLVALLQHGSIQELATGWMITSGLVVLVWLVHGVLTLRSRQQPMVGPRWAPDEILVLIVLIAGFVAILPTLNLTKIDGDAYAVASFSADALAGLPLNATEPIFGTDLGPGVRMLFNQTLPLAYLWSYFSGIDPITLASTASRAMPALWVLLAAYTLGRAAVKDNRRFGLFTAAVTLLVYVAAPFLRGDNVSLFFFERTNADKFLVPVTMLPVAFALAIRYVRDGQWPAWVAAALVVLAVSAIHPLVAAMLTVGLVGFAGFHLLLNLRQRTAWRRVAAIGGLVVAAMALPLLQLVIARGDAPLADSYPTSFAGWSVGQRLVPALPFLELSTLDYYGPLPSLAEMNASQTDSSETNPFLLWRFAVNMARRRLIIFDVNRYISDPSLLYEPPYLLAILLLPLLAFRAWRNRSDVGAQFAVGSTLAVLFIMFNPWVTPMVGSLVMPWILWRFVWVLPYALVIALATAQLAEVIARWIARSRDRNSNAVARGHGVVMFGLVAVAALALSPAIYRNIQNLHDRTSSPYYFPTPMGIFSHLRQATASGPATVLADQDLSVAIPAYVANASIVAHRMPTTSEIFPADRQSEALQRLIDQDAFFRSSFLTPESMEVLRRYGVRYVVTASGSDLDTQLRLSPQWFAWQLDDQSYSLYAVDPAGLPANSETLLGNTAIASQQWELAKQRYQAALFQDPGDLLALLGLAEIAHAHGDFNTAVQHLQSAIDQDPLVNVPNLHYRLGQFDAERGKLDSAKAEFIAAESQAPQVARFHESLGDVCLTLDDKACAVEQYQQAVATRNLPSQDARLIAEGDLWRRRGHTDDALALYQQAVDLRPSLFNQLTLLDSMIEIGQYDRAEAQVARLRGAHPLSSEVVAVQANLAATQGQTDRAVDLYRQAIAVQAALAQDSSRTQLALAQVLLDANQLDEASTEIDQVLARQPSDPLAYRLQGDYWHKRHEAENAVTAYQRSLALDPTQIETYIALRNQLRQQGGRPEELNGLLEAMLARNAGDASLAIDLGDQRQRVGDTYGAIAAYGEALINLNALESSGGLRPLTTSASQALVHARLAGLYEDAGQIDLAMNYYQAAVGAAPDVAWPRVLLGDALRRRGEPAAAEASYRAAIDHDPDQAEGYMRLADLLFALGRAGEASEYSQKIPSLALARLEQALGVRSAGSPDLSRLLSVSSTGVAALQSDETTLPPPDQSVQTAGVDGSTVGPVVKPYQLGDRASAAIEEYRQQIDQAARENRDPVMLARYYKDLGDLYVSYNQREQAEAAYRQSLDFDRWWPDTHLALAEVVAARGAFTETVQLVQTAVDIAPGAVEAQLALARQQEQRGEDAFALETYQSAAAAHPGNAQATLALAQAWQARGRIPEATHVYTQTIAMNPGTAAAYSGLAEVYVDQARYKEAHQMLHQALELDHLDVVATIRLGDVEQRTGNVEEALKWYEQAAKLSPPGHPSNKTLLVALIGGGHYDVALRFADEVLAVRPDDTDMLLKLAQVYRVTGRLDEAQAAVKKAIRPSGADAQPLVELAQINELQGRPDLALDSYMQAVGLEPGAAEHYLAASRLLANQGRFDEADALLKRGQIRAVRPDVLTVALHDLLMARGDAPSALASLNQALQARGPQLDLLLALAAHYDTVGQPAEAQQQYDQALELFSYSADVHLALANRVLRTGAGGSALYYGRLAHLLARADPQPLLTLGRAYGQANQVDEAAGVYSRTLALEPTLVDAYLDLGALYQERGKVSEARALYERGLAAVPYSGELLGRYTALLADQGDDQLAAALVDQAVGQTPSVATLLAKAALHTKLGEPDQAIETLWAAVEKEPASVDALLALGDVYALHHSAAAARDVYSRLIGLYPGLADGYLRQGGLAESQGNVAEARDLYERGLVAAPSSSELLSRYALLLANQDKRDMAQQVMNDAVKRAPDVQNLLARAGVFTELGVTDQAMKDLQVVLAIKPASQNVLLALGDLYAQGRKPAEAKRQYQAVVDLYPGLPVGYLRLGNLAAAEGNPQMAGPYYEQGLAVAPYSAELLSRYAVLLAEQKDTGRAKELADKAVKLAPTPQALTARAAVYVALGDIDRAALDLQTALAAEPASLDGWLALGDLYAAHDRLADAKATYGRVVELYPNLPAGYLRLGKLADDQGDKKEAQRYMTLAREVQKTAAASSGAGEGG